jgi:hypothetical protein
VPATPAPRHRQSKGFSSFCFYKFLPQNYEILLTFAKLWSLQIVGNSAMRQKTGLQIVGKPDVTFL